VSPWRQLSAPRADDVRIWGRRGEKRWKETRVRREGISSLIKNYSVSKTHGIIDNVADSQKYSLQKHKFILSQAHYKTSRPVKSPVSCQL
jgi:hypothetical protein